MNIADKIKSRGHWQIVIRPDIFEPNRIPKISEAEELIERCSVRLRGWDFPHMGKRHERIRGADYVELSCDWELHVELWRFHQSQMFVFLGGFVEDWDDQASFFARGVKPGSRPTWSIGGVVFRFTEVFELATRLSIGRYPMSVVNISILARGLNGRLLTVDDIRRAQFGWEYAAKIDELPYSRSFASQELVARGKDLALDAAAYFFERFDWQPGLPTLRSFQSELGPYGRDSYASGSDETSK